MAITLGSNSARIGHALGTGLAQPIHQHLDLMAQQKMQEIQQNQLAKQQHAERQRYAAGLEPLLGKETASFLSNLGPDERKSALQNLEALMQFSGNGQQGQQQQMPQQQGGLDALMGNAAPVAQQEPQQGSLTAQEQEEIDRLLNPEAFKKTKKEKKLVGEVQKDNNKLAQDKTKLVQDIFTSPYERREREKLDIAKEKLQEQKMARGNKEVASKFSATSGVREKINNKARSAEENLFRIKEAKELQETGKLNGQSFLTFLKGAGLEDVEGLLTGETVAFNKIMADFQRGAKEVYGGRITNTELEQFLKTIPNLYQSPEGRGRIFSMMEYFNRGAVAEQQTMREIIKENGGVPPYDLHEEVIDRSRKKLDQLSNKFKKELGKALSEAAKSQGSSPTSVALANAAGSLLGTTAKALKGGAKGALGGAAYGFTKGGIPGALTGAIGGGLAGGALGLHGAL